MKSNIAEIIERDGFAALPGAISPDLLSELSAAVASVEEGPGVVRRGEVYAFRNLFQNAPRTKSALHAPALRELVGAVLGGDAFCVRGIFLGKSPRANWAVRWHQDATITVKERGDAVGFGPWSMKAGVQHVMAPPGVLSAMLSVRIHLDDCGEEDGAMKVIPTSHQYGRLPEDSIGQFTRVEATVCEAKKGCLVAMRPLLLHCSHRARRPGPRRVIQLDFSARKLPLPLEWNESYSLS